MDKWGISQMVSDRLYKQKDEYYSLLKKEMTYGDVKRHQETQIHTTKETNLSKKAHTMIIEILATMAGLQGP